MSTELQTLEADNDKTALAPNAGIAHLTDEEIVTVLGWNAQGKTQQWIAANLNPPRAQSTVHYWLKQYTKDTTPIAKQILAARAASNTLKAIETATARDLIALLKGGGVIADTPQTQNIIQIGISHSDLKFDLSPGEGQ